VLRRLLSLFRPRSAGGSAEPTGPPESTSPAVRVLPPVAAPASPPGNPPPVRSSARSSGALPVRLVFDDGSEMPLPADPDLRKRVAYLLRAMLPPPPPV
jgi:hypothetical protein